VADLHVAVIDDDRQVVGREAVRLEQHGVFQQRVLVAAGPTQHDVDGRRALQGNLQPDDRRDALGALRRPLGLAQVAAMAVVAGRLAVGDLDRPHGV
jgi:hypothetical protein